MKFAEHRRRRPVARWPHAFLLALCCICAAVAAESRQGHEQKQNTKPVAYFTDIAKRAGLTMMNTFGGVATKKYIIEKTGTDAAVFGGDHAGSTDIFNVNGTKLDGEQAKGEAASNHLSHNKPNGTFADITKKAGLVH